MRQPGLSRSPVAPGAARTEPRIATNAAVMPRPAANPAARPHAEPDPRYRPEPRMERPSQPYNNASLPADGQRRLGQLKTQQEQQRRALLKTQQEQLRLERAKVQSRYDTTKTQGKSETPAASASPDPRESIPKQECSMTDG